MDPLKALDELENLHRSKEHLKLQITATINLVQQSIAKSLRLKKEIQKLNYEKVYPIIALDAFDSVIWTDNQTITN